MAATDPSMHLDPRASRAEYQARVNRVVDHIERHLDQRLSLRELARVAHFSPHHFHRIFTSLAGEPVGQFVQRLRVERAARRLLSQPEHSITAIALDCGFASSASFARAFRTSFGMSASELRKLGSCDQVAAESKIGQAVRKPGSAAWGGSWYLEGQAFQPTWRYDMQLSSAAGPAQIQIQQLPEHHVVYVRHVGPYGQPSVVRDLVQRLQSWASARDLITPESMLLLVPHDSPAVTAQEKLRLSVCLTVRPGTRGEGAVGAMQVPGGKFAVARFEIEPAQIAQAWNSVMGQWLPESGYQPDERLCYEVVRVAPTAHPRGLAVLEICVPIRPL